MWLPLSGILYSGESLKSFTNNRPYWLIIKCPHDLMEFYLYQIMKEGFSVSQPLAGSHISVVRNEKPLEGLWKTCRGLSIRFEYQPKVMTNGKHWWLPVRSEEILELRESLGLKREPRVRLHLTVGVETKLTESVVKKSTREVLSRLEVLSRMKDKLPYDLWKSSLEYLEYRALKERFI